MERSEYVKQWKDKRKAAGLCVGCGQPLDRDGSYCTKCREKINKITRERRQWYLSHKICPRCGNNDLMGDETICPECRAKGTNNTLKKRNRDTYNSYHNEWAKSTYKKKKGSWCMYEMRKTESNRRIYYLRYVQRKKQRL